jgi:hypothetical protein
LWPFSSCLRYFPRRPISSIFPSITCFPRQFLLQKRPVFWPSSFHCMYYIHLLLVSI